MVDESALKYIKAETKYEKTKVIADVMEAIRNGNADGGFVKKDFYSGQWFEIGLERARDKVGHAIRKVADKILEQTDGKSRKGRRKAKTAVTEHTAKNHSSTPSPVSPGKVPMDPLDSQTQPAAQQYSQRRSLCENLDAVASKSSSCWIPQRGAGVMQLPRNVFAAESRMRFLPLGLSALPPAGAASRISVAPYYSSHELNAFPGTRLYHHDHMMSAPATNMLGSLSSPLLFHQQPVVQIGRTTTYLPASYYDRADQGDQSSWAGTTTSPLDMPRHVVPPRSPPSTDYTDERVPTEDSDDVVGGGMAPLSGGSLFVDMAAVGPPSSAHGTR